MNEKEFNLLDEAWIRVMLPDCSTTEVSLTDALTNAHLYKSLAGETEAQNVAVLRLLIAVTHAIFTRVGLLGEENYVEDEKTALDRWHKLKTEGKLPEKPIKDYSGKWHERFWLFHPSRPFGQAPGAANGTENTAAKLNGEISESNNKARLFSFAAGDGKSRMTYAESARWLLFLNSFDDCAAKQRDKSHGSRSMTVGWLGKLGLITAVGNTLFDTILMNMPMLVNGETIWQEDDQPFWEMDQICEEERRTIDMPQDLAGLLTLQSRRLFLIRDQEAVTGYKVLGGDAFSEQNAINEPMTLWRYVEDKKSQTAFYIPRRHDRTRQIWRDFGAIVNIGEKEIRPGVISWCGLLQRKGWLPDYQMITFRITCVRYDSSQSSSITDTFSDALSFHTNLLLDAGAEWVREINRQLQLIEDAAKETGNLAENLAKACGQRDDSLREASRAAKEQFYLMIDNPFREWLLRLDPEQDSDERLALAEEWQDTVRKIALSAGRQMVEDKGEIAFV